jgi:hypothetical protein
MFACYFMGGLDFRGIFASLFWLSLAHVFLFMSCSFAAMTRGLSKSRTLVLLAYGIGMLYFVFGGIAMIGYFVLDNNIDELIDFSGDDFIGLFFLALAYLVAFFAMFYSCCHLMCPETDTRESHLRVFGSLGWLGLLMAIAADAEFFSGNEFASFTFLAFFFYWGFGMMFWVNREDIPVIWRNRYQKNSRFTRALAWLFEPGRRGATRNMVAMGLMNAAVCALGALFFNWWAPGPYHRGASDDQVLAFALMPFTAFYFLIVGDWLARRIAPLAKTPATRRAGAGAFWAFLGITFLVAMVISDPNFDVDNDPLAQRAGLVLTPILTWTLYSYSIGFSALEFIVFAGLQIVFVFFYLGSDYRRLGRQMKANISERRELVEEPAAEEPAPSSDKKPAAPSAS